MSGACKGTSLRVVDLLGEKFAFFNSLETTKISRRLRLSVYIDVVLLINFPEQFKLYASTSNIREVIKFYNLGDKTFETDFSQYRASIKQFNFSKTMKDKCKTKLAYLHQFAHAL